MRNLIPVLPLLLFASNGYAVTLVHDAWIITMDTDVPRAEAMVIGDDGRILALGEAGALRERYLEADSLQLDGRTVLPGLIDAHGHLLNLGHALMSVDLMGANSKAEIVRRLQRFATTLPDDAWLTGRGWDQNRWDEKLFPTTTDLDIAFPDRPVWLERVDGHAGWANSVALQRVKRDLAGNWQPEGGRILRDDEGQPTGVFIDAAAALVDEIMPPPGDAMHRRALELAVNEAARLGLTGVHDAGVSRDTLQLFQHMADEEALPIRVTAMADGDGEALAWLCENGVYRHEGGRLQMRAVKLYMDGALGSRGAALLRDYSDEPGNRGLLVTPEARLRAAVAKAVRCGVQVNTHAIGDRGNRLVLDTYEALVPVDGRDDRRFRIEHAQIVADADIQRFAALDVIASMQPIHATSDMPWAQARIGRARLAGAYAWQRFIGSGTRLAFGSDFPVEAANPFHGLYAAITRQDADSEPAGGWLPDQRVDLATAVKGFTIDAAYAGFAEAEVGSLAVGKRADFIVVNADPFRATTAALRATTVIATYVDGRRVYPAATR